MRRRTSPGARLEVAWLRCMLTKILFDCSPMERIILAYKSTGREDSVYHLYPAHSNSGERFLWPSFEKLCISQVLYASATISRSPGGSSTMFFIVSSTINLLRRTGSTIIGRNLFSVLLVGSIGIRFRRRKFSDSARIL